MKKVVRLVFAVALLALMLAPVPVAAQGLTYGSTWRIQNLEGESGALTIMFYDESTGNEIEGARINDQIAANGMNNYFAVNNLNLPTPFAGSAVIASNREVRVVHNLYGSDAAGVGNWAATSGYTKGSQHINLPLVMRANGGYNTWFSVQNAGLNPTTVTVAFRKGLAGNDYDTLPVEIKPGAAHIFDQKTMVELGARFVGAAVISSEDEPVVASLVQERIDNLLAYDGFGTGTELVAQIGAPDFIAPIFQYHNSGYSSSVNVQNISQDTPTTVTVEFVPSEMSTNPGVFIGTRCTETLTIDPGASQIFGLYSFARENHPDAGASTCWANNGTNRFLGSARVIANSENQPLNAVVNQHNFGVRKASSYSAFIRDEASRCVSAPTIQDRHSGYWTSLHIYNAGASVATVDIDYTNTANDVTGLTVQPGSMTVVFNANAIAPSYNGSALVRGRDDGKSDQLLVIVNQNNLTYVGDGLLTYNAFNLEACPPLSAP